MLRKKLSFYMGSLFVITTFVSQAMAAQFNVTTATEFQNALNTASSNGENDTIYVAAGTYNLSATLIFSSTENYPLTIMGAGIGLTILDGGERTQILNLFTSESSAHLTVQNITFRKGKSSDNSGGLHIQTTAASITIENSEFNDNSASILGGGANVVTETGAVFISNCTFRRNSAIDDAGGLNVGTTDGTIMLSNSIFEENTVPGVYPGVPAKDGGGAILYVDGSGHINMTNNTFNGNRAADGAGGCMLYLLGSGVSVTCNNNYFSHNIAQLDGGGCFMRVNDSGTIICQENQFFKNSTVSYVGGGSMIHLNDGTLDFSGNTFIDNTAGGEDGGGAWIWNGTGTLDITHNTFTGNDAPRNGGGSAVSTDQGTVNCNRNIFYNNTAINVGGGLSYATGNGALNLVHNTFYGDSAQEGGGIYLYFDQSGAQTAIINNIFWHNSPQAISMSGAATATATYSDIQGGTGEPWFGIGCIDTDPLFANPMSGDFHLTWANFPTLDATRSPCIDAGDPASPKDPDNTRADMGALSFSQWSGIDDHIDIKNSERLYQNYPNPFNSSAVISFRMPLRGHVTLTVFDLFGREVKRLVDGVMEAGDHPVLFDARGLASGLYVYHIEADFFRKNLKALLIK